MNEQIHFSNHCETAHIDYMNLGYLSCEIVHTANKVVSFTPPRGCH